MDKNKFNRKIYCNIHTLSVRSDTKPICDVNGVDLKRICGKESDKESYSVFINPNAYIDNDIDSLESFNKILEEVENVAGLTNCRLLRADMKFDSYDDDYDESLKLNKLVALLSSITFNLNNRYQSIDPLTFENLIVRVQSDYYEVENYNKKLCVSHNHK